LNCSFIREDVGKSKEKVMYLQQTILDKRAKFKKFGDENPQAFNEYIHLKQYSPLSRYYGIPEWMTALAAMYLDRNANTFNIKRFDNNAVPDHVLLTKGGKIDKDTKINIKDFFEKNFKGVDKTGKLLHINVEEPEGTLDLKKVTEAIKEASFHILRMDNREEIVDAHGVPRRLVGLTRAGGLGDANQTKEEMNMFRNVNLKPRQARVEFIFNTFILPVMGINSLQFKVNRMEAGSDATDAIYYQTLTAPNAEGESILNIEEAREELGYKKRDTTVAKSSEEIEVSKVAKALIKLRTMLKAIG
jgi:capsid portal protein